MIQRSRFHDWTRRLLAVQKINIFRVRFLFRGAMIEITLSRLCFPSFSRYVTAASRGIFGVAAASRDAGRDTRPGLASALTIAIFEIVINRESSFALIKTSGARERYVSLLNERSSKFAPTMHVT